jgi:hypothetical protein
MVALIKNPDIVLVALKAARNLICGFSRELVGIRNEGEL